MYSLTGPGVDQDPMGIFRIIPSTGWIQATQSLDREAGPEYRVRAQGFNSQELNSLVFNSLELNPV